MPVQMPIPLFTSLPYMGPVGPSCHHWDAPVSADAHKDPEFARELRAHLQFLNWTAENLRKQMQVR